ncbi:MAG: hypothetical protein AAF513_08300 [Pseudomonadota bacterium]
MNSPNGYVFDLDGTLARVEHRRTLLEGERPDWHSFNKAALFDPPNEAVAKVMRALFDAGYDIWIVSGRSDVAQLETRGWLGKHAIPYHHLLMRSASDHRADHVLKREWAMEYNFPASVIAVFDDRKSVVDMWRELNIPCFQVAPGDF